MQIYFFFGLPWFLRFWIHSQCNCYCRFLLLKEFRAGGLAVVAIILLIIDLLISSAGPIRSNLTRLTVEFIVDSSVGNFRKLICIWILIARRSVECFRGGNCENCENCEMLDWFFFTAKSFAFWFSVNQRRSFCYCRLSDLSELNSVDLIGLSVCGVFFLIDVTCFGW